MVHILVFLGHIDVLLVADILAMDTEIGSGDCLAWAARDASGILSPYRFNRRCTCYSAQVLSNVILTTENMDIKFF